MPRFWRKMQNRQRHSATAPCSLYTRRNPIKREIVRPLLEGGRARQVLKLSSCSFALGIRVFSDVHERHSCQMQVACFFGAWSTDLEVDNIAPDAEGSLLTPHRIASFAVHRRLSPFFYFSRSVLANIT